MDRAGSGATADDESEEPVDDTLDERTQTDDAALATPPPLPGPPPAIAAWSAALGARIETRAGGEGGDGQATGEAEDAEVGGPDRKTRAHHHAHAAGPGNGAAPSADALQSAAPDRPAAEPAVETVSASGKTDGAVADDEPSRDPRLSVEFRSGETRTVVVLENRAAAPAPNAGPAVPAIAPDAPPAADAPVAASERSDASIRLEQAAQRGPLKQIRIELHPSELGSVTANLRLAGDQMTVEIQAHTDKAYRHLTEEKAAIARALHGLGLQVDSISVQLAPRTESNMGQDNFSSAQNFRNPQSENGGQRGNSGQGGRNDGSFMGAGPERGEAVDARPRRAAGRGVYI